MRRLNTRSDVVNKLGKERLEKIYDLADVYHCYRRGRDREGEL